MCAENTAHILPYYPGEALAAADQPLQLVPIFRPQPYRIFLRNHGCRTSRTAV